MSDEQQSIGPSDPNPAIPPTTVHPLSYETPIDHVNRTPVNWVGMIFAFLLGLAIAAGGVLFGSALLFLMISDLHTPFGHRDHFWVRLLAGFYAAAFLAIVGVIVRRARRKGFRSLVRWWALGLLVGLAIGCLIEGCCFGFSR